MHSLLCSFSPVKHKYYHHHNILISNHHPCFIQYYFRLSFLFFLPCTVYVNILNTDAVSSSSSSSFFSCFFMGRHIRSFVSSSVCSLHLPVSHQPLVSSHVFLHRVHELHLWLFSSSPVQQLHPEQSSPSVLGLPPLPTLKPFKSHLSHSLSLLPANLMSVH